MKIYIKKKKTPVTSLFLSLSPMKSRPLSYAVLWECIQGRHIARHKQERTLIDTQSVHEACL